MHVQDIDCAGFSGALGGVFDGMKCEFILGDRYRRAHGSAFPDHKRTAYIVKRFVGKGFDYNLRPDAGRVPMVMAIIGLFSAVMFRLSQ